MTSTVTAFLLVLLVAACASPQAPTSMVTVPEKLKPGANESLAMIVPAKGVQLYECRARIRSRSVRRAWNQDRPTLCRAALGIDRW